MAHTPLTVAIRPKHEGGDLVPFGAFLEVTQHLRGLLMNLADELHADMAGSLEWYIARAGQGGVAFDLRGVAVGADVPDVGGDVVAALLGGLAALERRPVRPDLFSDDSLRRARDMALVLTNGVGAIDLGAGERRVSLTLDTAANVESILQPRYGYVGSVEGIVQTISLRDRWYFNVYDTLHRRSVECRFRPELLEEVKLALGQRVLVSGEMKTDVTGYVLYVAVTQLRLLPSPGDLPQPDEIFGIDPEFTQGIDSVEYVKTRRD